MEGFRISWAAARVNAGLTQDEVAKKMGVSKNTIVAWEKYKSEPSISQGKALVEIYKIPMSMIDTQGV